jgi:hypothetical protein
MRSQSDQTVHYCSNPITQKTTVSRAADLDLHPVGVYPSDDTVSFVAVGLKSIVAVGIREIAIVTCVFTDIRINTHIDAASTPTENACTSNREELPSGRPC